MRFGMLALVSGLLLVASAARAEASTLDDLLLAYREDVNQAARYAAYAEQAEREGHGYAARLFRATAEAERVRAGGHAQALRSLGAQPTSEPAPAEVRKDTRWNLLRALAKESTELRRDYPLRSEQARREGNAEAELSFLMARGAHEGLVTLYREAIRDLPRGRDGGELHVCRTCGHVARGPAPDRCPVSLSPAATFKRIG